MARDVRASCKMEEHSIESLLCDTHGVTSRMDLPVGVLGPELWLWQACFWRFWLSAVRYSKPGASAACPGPNRSTLRVRAAGALECVFSVPGKGTEGHF